MGNVVPLSDTYPEQKPDQIISYDTGDNYNLVGGQRWNPDDLVGKKGLRIYSQMMVDEQVKSVTEFKLNAILGRGHQFKFLSTKLSEEEQKQRIGVFETVVKRIRGSWVDAVEGVASGREYGFSITEKVYGQIEVEGSTFAGINMLLTRDPCSFEFFADEYGMLTGIKQCTNQAQKIEIDPDRVIHYVHKPKWDLLYGRSELRAAYRAWYLKDITLKNWALHLERFGSGIPIAKRVDENAPAYGSPEYTSLQNTMREFKSFTSLILPRGVEVEVLFPSTTDQYERALQYHDLAIAKSQLVPNLLGLSQAGQTGSFAQSDTQLKAFFWTTGADGARISECFNEQLFRDLGDQNWGDGDYPVFCFKPASTEHIKWMIETWNAMVGAKVVISTEKDEQVLREMLEMPEREEDAEPLVDPMAERQMALDEKVADQGIQQDKADAEARQGAALARFTQELNDIRAKLTSVNVTVHNPAPAPAESPGALPALADVAGAVVVPHGKLHSCSSAAFTRAVQRVAFSVIEQRTNNYAVAAVDNMAGIIAKAVKRALGDDANLQQLVDDDPADVATVDLSPADRGKLKTASRELLGQAWKLGSDLAANEIDRAKGERTEMAIRKLRFAALRDNAAGYFDAQSFRMAGDASDQAKKIIQQELQNGIKQGKALTDVRVAIWDRMVAKGLSKRQIILMVETNTAVNSALNELWVDTVDDVAAYLDTLVRTNTFEALNEARFAEFTDPEVADFVEALQYAAVLDSSTTIICTELGTGGTNGEGVIYKADSDLWDQFRPPNHFNCRSLLIPVTVIDGWDGQESAPPLVEPQEGFK
jgi:SPP1 gp7 family putative phage head morphogenesis protein